MISNFFQLVPSSSGELVLLQDCVERAVALLIHSLVLHTLRLLLLDLDQLLLHSRIVGCIHGAGKSSKALLLQDIIDLSVLAPDVEEQGVLLLEYVVAQGAPEPVHERGILLLQLLHEVPAAVLLQKLNASLFLTTYFAFKVIVARG